MIINFLYYSFFIIFPLFQSASCDSVYNISSSQSLLREQTLLSPGEVFELGFFNPNGSSNRYIGIWYKDLSPTKYVWVTNRGNPLAADDRLASLTIGRDGNLVLLDGNKNVVWSTNVTVQSNDSSAALSDDGNLVLSDRSSGKEIWASFDHPSDTMLVGMKMGINVKTGVKLYYNSWKSESDPSPGNYTIGITAEDTPQGFIWNGTAIYYRTGQWDKSKFIGIPDMSPQYLTGFYIQQDSRQGTTYLSFNYYNSSFRGFIYLAANGTLTTLIWLDRWVRTWHAPSSGCQVYGICGPFGICSDAASPICRCFKGFVPKSKEEWTRGNWTGGCVRKTELSCKGNTNTSAVLASASRDGFRKMSNLKIPDSSTYLSNLKDSGKCLDWCQTNCSCLAYSYVNSIGCLVWTDEKLIDTMEFSTQLGEDLFVRGSDEGKSSRNLIIGITVPSSFIILGAAFYGLYRCRAARDADISIGGDSLPGTAKLGGLNKDDEFELPVFSLQTILTATNNFGTANKLGRGGFGPVYKGKLQGGVEVAVKRLSSSSGQGMEEFKTEIMLISKLQHRNLIKLLGCCFEEEEKILVYEYMPNKSLDTFLFDLKGKEKLNWEARFHIIQGIARGLLYLHRDSSLRVIHRDLKVSNILLDDKMNPKISDFGLARMFEATQDLVDTRRVVGTLYGSRYSCHLDTSYFAGKDRDNGLCCRGYMSPEYAMAGTFSEKSDVYSFGVLLLEIVSGVKNTARLSFDGQDCALLAYAYGLWRVGRVLEMVDSSLSDPIPLYEIERCIQIGLLCVQDHAVDRPSMPDVLLMLGGESGLHQPKPPPFTILIPSDEEMSQQNESLTSRNGVDDSTIDARAR